jgi:sodium/potassium/calcium exchanger 6
MLGSTAEDFFSPSLEMFSMKMGLPPRFAGVTLLALGNGAADVSATISAITQNPEDGYQMSLGALTGAGMFVGTMVAGIVIVTADGVKCRGALVRDVIMFMMTIGLVYYFFSQGEIGSRAISSFFWSYFSFVLVVLCADIYHRAVVLPRLQRQTEEQNEQIVDPGIAEHDEDEFSNHPQHLDQSRPEVELSHARTVRYGPPTNAFQSPLHTTAEDTENQDIPLSPSGIRKTRDKNVFAENLDRFMIAMSNYGPNEGKDGGDLSGWSGGLEVSSNEKDHHLKLHGTKGILNKRGSRDDQEDANLATNDPISTYTALMEGVDNMCTVEGSLVSAMGTSWSQSFSHAKDEFKMHFADYINDIKENEENNLFDRFFLFCELPFTIMRKLSIPIPCEDYYCRGIVAASVACTPLWIGIYAWMEHDANLFIFGGFPYIEICLCFTGIIGILITRFAPVDYSELSLKISFPITFLGFLIAATWIDAIADQLVKLLTFLGVICRIPGSIMGLTVLAWGNSMGDLSANLTMAKKGLANMAITACFAGPVFNILIGLGGGFGKLNAVLDQEFAEVELTPSIKVGLLFLFINLLLVLISGLLVNKGHIPRGYGYVALTLYTIYIIMSISLQYYLQQNR